MKLLIRSLSLHSARGRNYPRDKCQYEGGDFCRRAPPPTKTRPSRVIVVSGFRVRVRMRVLLHRGACYILLVLYLYSSFCYTVH